MLCKQYAAANDMKYRGELGNSFTMPCDMKYLNRDGFMLWKTLLHLLCLPCSPGVSFVAVKGVAVYVAAVLIALYTRNASAEERLNTNKG